MEAWGSASTMRLSLGHQDACLPTGENTSFAKTCDMLRIEATGTEALLSTIFGILGWGLR